jgi:hypothetical protein
MKFDTALVDQCFTVNLKLKEVLVRVSCAGDTPSHEYFIAFPPPASIAKRTRKWRMKKLSRATKNVTRLFSKGAEHLRTEQCLEIPNPDSRKRTNGQRRKR